MADAYVTAAEQLPQLPKLLPGTTPLESLRRWFKGEEESGGHCWGIAVEIYTVDPHIETPGKMSVGKGWSQP